MAAVPVSVTGALPTTVVPVLLDSLVGPMLRLPRRKPTLVTTRALASNTPRESPRERFRRSQIVDELVVEPFNYHCSRDGMMRQLGIVLVHGSQ